MTHLLVFFGSLLALAGVVARSLSSHAIYDFLSHKGKLDNFNLAADYLVIHGLVLLGVAVLHHLFPDAKYLRAGWLFIIGSILFQGTVLLKSCISIQPFGFMTPIGGFILMAGWGVLGFAGLATFLGEK